jgi:osmotically-inducible protein OsmY
MKNNRGIVVVLLLAGGCVRTSALERGARVVRGNVTPMARAFTDGSRRLVRYAGQTAEDATLLARLKTALAVRKGLDEGEIHLDVEEGIVRLTGQVSSAARKRTVAEVVRNTVGVTKVVNRLKIVPATTAAEG